MAIITDYTHVPIGVRKIAVAAVALVALCVVGEHLVTALKTGVAQRLSSAPKYTRSERPCMFWLHVIFFAVSAVLFAAALGAILWHWHGDKVFKSLQPHDLVGNERKEFDSVMRDQKPRRSGI